MLLLKPSAAPKCCDVCMAPEAVQAKFQDGFQGHLCWRCAQKMFKARTNGKDPYVDREDGRAAAVAQ